MKPPSPQCSTFMNSRVSGMGSTRTSNNQKSSGVRYSSQALVMPTISTRDTISSNSTGKELREEIQSPVATAVTRVQGSKHNDPQPHSATLASNHSAVRVYSSSSDPVHVRPTDSRSAATIDAIKRQLGAVGVRHQSSDHSVKPLSAQSSLFSNSHLEKNGSSSLSNRYNSKSHQQIVVRQKASQRNKEWKPKSSQRSSLNSPGIIKTPAKSVLHPNENPKDSETDAVQVQDKSSRVNNYENRNVIIAEHIRVIESDRYRLTFGSFGTEIDSSRDFVSDSHTVGNAENSSGEPSSSLSASAPESSSDETSASKHVDLPDDQIQNSRSNSTASGVVSENELLDKKESSSPQKLDGYADIGLFRNNSASYTPFELQQQQEAPELASLSAYDAQSGYDIPYIRPTTDETIRRQVLPSPWEVLSSHAANSNPVSTATMLLQQHQPPMPHMYPQVHVSHRANLMPYRQFLSPVYVPPMQMAGYSSNAIYPHPSNGSSYLLLPGGSSHLSANSLKYGIQQFKPIPASSPTRFGNFTSPTGYAINAPGIVGSAAGLEDSSRLKYKDGNLYVPNAQFPGLYHPPPPPQLTAMANPHHLGPGMGAAAAPGTQVDAYQQPQLGHLNWTTNF
ncbi:A-agglutinin anchorage subunit like [Actinidia chinensis var. chinensis]|uniref:A-agglutinin anchorage subunit like n=1 Tax=Actinidia chinensis var. chinensis TaxID=1590841 RepID=A0A2R6R0D3_ACTCC|nr:A-agglutinin anchorage subunit like [Actinidia chinensis var. chinensis]